MTGLRTLTILGLLTLPAVASAQQQEQAGEPKHGAELAQARCAGCHAIGKEESSPAAGATSFAALVKRTNANNLDLLQKLENKNHPPIPGPALERQDARDIVAFMRTSITGGNR